MIDLSNLDLTTIELLKRYNSLDTFVKNYLYSSIVSNVKISKEDIEKELEEIYNLYEIKDEPQLSKWLSKNNFKTKNDLIENIKDTLKPKVYAEENFSKKVESKFIKEKDDLDQVIYQLIRCKSVSKARALYLEIKDDKTDFGSLAKIHSEGPEKITRGIVGPVALSKANPVVIQLLKTAEPGEVNKPIFAEGWNLIIQLETIIRAQLDDNMRTKLAVQLFNEWLNIEVSELIKTKY
tara:strand:+ start:534 stop:1244 length:711 start_codon:yes stop_codon:yes gene_type:complete